MGLKELTVERSCGLVDLAFMHCRFYTGLAQNGLLEPLEEN